MTAVCKSTRYGEGCGHPVNDHIGKGGCCCCCNWQQNDPTHVDQCARCRAILAAYAARSLPSPVTPNPTEQQHGND